MKQITSTVTEKIADYPDKAKHLFKQIRGAIFSLEHRDGIGDITETIKWGEPAYLTKGGSTVRIDWKPKTPEEIYIFFNCKTKLIETFREIYSDVFVFDGNRAIVLRLDKEIPFSQLTACISMTLRYHHIKHLPLLGA